MIGSFMVDIKQARFFMEEPSRHESERLHFVQKYCHKD